MARSKKDPGSPRLVDVFGSFSLVERVPRSLVEKSIEDAGKTSIRDCVLNATLTLYLVLLMALYSDLAAEDVLCRVMSVVDPENEYRRVNKQTISEARKRLGAKPLESAYNSLAQASRPESGRYRLLSVYALDGSCMDLPDSKPNSEHFGRAASSRGRTAFPQLRFTALVEQGSNFLLGAALGPYSVGEHTLARESLGALPADSLVLMDRGLVSFAIVSQVLERKAHVLCRVKRSLELPVKSRLPDGSYLSCIYASVNDRRTQTNPLAVRVVSFRIEGSEEEYRLLTSLLDPRKAPARELAALYAQRWNIEEAFRDFKTRLKGSWDTLRSKTPDGVRQEFWALLTVYNTVRGCLMEAALLASTKPSRLSFLKAIRILQDAVPNAVSGST